MFEKTLTDVVKGIRASKRDTALYISQCIAEIKTEINSSDMYVKANALQKLTFLQMMGYSMNWASFQTIEVMSSPRFAHKRIGYLAASQGFTQHTEVILLTTNLLKKELRGAVGGSMNGVYEAGLAINCISNIVTEELARELLPELTNLTKHPQPYLRKKAILCLFKLFVKYPQGLRLTFAKIQQCLDDSNQSVVSCAVNVITELSDKNPKNYLHLAPAFFQLLTQSSNNWMLIKVVKLLGSLVPEEPRLARKLLEPLAAIVKNTQAKSLLFEAVHTITLCLPYCRKNDGSMPAIVPEIVTLCAQTLRTFVEENDQNLKYLGLVGFGSLMQSHPKVLSAPDYRPLILACLSDQDVTIRTRALDLLTGMASRKNLMELVTQLLKHVELATGTYKHDLVAKIVEMCSSEKYALLQDFKWYLNVLFQLGHMRGVEAHADLLRAQITDVSLRVLPVRAYAVRRSMQILLEGEGDVSDDPYGDNGRGKNIMPEILPAVAWIIGEYCDLIRESMSLDDDDEDEELAFFFDDDSKGTYHAVIQVLTNPWNTKKLPTTTQKVYVQAAMKVLAAASKDKDVENSELEACVGTIQSNLTVYIQSTDVEVVERSFTAVELLDSLGLATGAFGSMPGLAANESDETSDEGADGDLLGMTQGSSQASSVKPTKAKVPSGPKSLASKIRAASDTLNYLFKPAPMKPSGAKAQRKKRSNPINVSIDLEAPVDLSVFEVLIEEEASYRTGSKLSMEAVNFTQQRPLHVEEPAAIPPMASMDIRSSTAFGAGVSHDASTSFQHPVGEVIGSTSRQRQGDPFYLDSVQPDEGNEERDLSSRFGTIQLLDSDDEDPNAVKDSKKRRKQKKAKRGKSKGTSEPAGLWSNDDVAGLGLPSTSAEVAVYKSDDDDDYARGKLAGRKSAQGKEFEGLAKVDLTTPLREDEVMPERKHHVVTDRPREKERTSSKVHKKKKKGKKASKKEAATGTVGDLLDLGDFGGGNEEGGKTLATVALAPVANDVNPVNAAFDDLLGLSAPDSTPQIGMNTELPKQDFQGLASKASPKSGKRPWIKASIKPPSTSGSSPVDWSKLSLAFRVYRTTHEGRLAATVVFRVSNAIGSSTISGLTLDLKENRSIAFDDIPAGAYSESDKIGPLPYFTVDASADVKGKLRVAGSSASTKISLPASLYLSPEENLTLEQVAEELSSSEWTSSSSKIDFDSGTTPEQVKQVVSSFLRAAPVSEIATNLSTATYAARSSSNARVRVLVKVKEDSVKVDIKSTSPQLGQALASDVKKVIL